MIGFNERLFTIMIVLIIILLIIAIFVFLAILVKKVNAEKVEPILILKIYDEKDIFPANCNLEEKVLCIYMNDTIFQNTTK